MEDVQDMLQQRAHTARYFFFSFLIQFLHNLQNNEKSHRQLDSDGNIFFDICSIAGFHSSCQDLEHTKKKEKLLRKEKLKLQNKFHIARRSLKLLEIYEF